MSAATEKATRLKGAEAILSDATIDDAMLARAGDAAADEAETISDVRGSAPYKRELLRVYVRRAVRAALRAEDTDEGGALRIVPRTDGGTAASP